MINILGVNISNLAGPEALEWIRNFLVDGGQHLIFTPNPEMLVDSQTDRFFKQALNKADLAPADGFGLVLAARYLHKIKLNRFPGVELMERVCALAVRENKSVYLVGGEEGRAAQTAPILFKKYPGLRIVGAESGINLRIDNTKYQILNTNYLTGLNFDSEENKKLMGRINLAKPDILFVAFGHPKQEKWLAEFIKEMPSVKIGMGVGGAFDYISGKIKRAPGLIRRVGLEWLWRAIRQPRRISRIYKATIGFIFLVLRNKNIET